MSGRVVAGVATALLGAVGIAPAAMPTRPTAAYRIAVRTGDRDDAGTDADVFVAFFGDAGTTPAVELDDGRDNFERGDRESFVRSVPDVGELRRIRVWHDDADRYSGWFLETVSVTRLRDRHRWTFPVHRWLARDEGDGAVDLVVPAGGAPHVTTAEERRAVELAGCAQPSTCGTASPTPKLPPPPPPPTPTLPSPQCAACRCGDLVAPSPECRACCP